MAKGIEYRGDTWLTQKKFAEEEKVSIQLVGMWVLRKHVTSRYFSEINKILIKEGSLKLKRKHEKE